MAINKQTIAVLAAIALTGGTKLAPPTGGTGASVSTTTYGRSGLNWRIKNGPTAPGAPGVMTVQGYDGAKWYDIFTIGGDVVANSEFSGVIPIESYVQAVRVICYGNTTNAVTFEATLSAVVA